MKIGWNRARRAIKSAAPDLSSRKVNQSPSYSLVFLLEAAKLVVNDSAEIALKLFASAILPNVHARLRFSDIQRNASVGESATALRGTLTPCKGRKQRNLPWPFESAQCGFNQRGERFPPSLDFRKEYYNSARVYPTFTAPIINGIGPREFNAARRRSFVLATIMKDGRSEIYTLSPGGCYPTCGAHMGMDNGNAIN